MPAGGSVDAESGLDVKVSTAQKSGLQPDTAGGQIWISPTEAHGALNPGLCPQLAASGSGPLAAGSVAFLARECAACFMQ